MNVLYVQHGHPPASFVMTELYELDRQGHNVAVCANSESEGVVHSEASALDVPVTRTGSVDVTRAVRSVPRFLSGVLAGRGRAFPFGLLRAHRARRGLSFVSSLPFEIDLVHVHFPVKGNLHAIDIAADLDVPLVVSTHAFEMFRSDLSATAVRMFAAATRIRTVSKYGRVYLRDELGVETPIDVVPTKIRLEKFHPGEREPNPDRLLTVGRLVPKKGHVYAIDAVADLATDYPEIQYHIVGAGPERDRLEARAENRGVSERVKFLGHVPEDRLRSEFAQASVFVLPCLIDHTGDRDGIPVVLKEAMAMGSVPVSTYVSGIPELIEDGETGVLVPERDSDSLAAAVEAMLRSPERRRTVAASARSSLEGSRHVTGESDDLVGSFRAAIRQ